MARFATVWNGTEQEILELAAAVGRNCCCPSAPEAGVRVTCAPHRMLIEDQRALDGLLFVRTLAARLLVEEWGGEPPDVARWQPGQPTWSSLPGVARPPVRATERERLSSR